MSGEGGLTSQNSPSKLVSPALPVKATFSFEVDWLQGLDAVSPISPNSASLLCQFCLTLGDV